MWLRAGRSICGAHVTQVYVGAKGARQTFCPGEVAPLDIVIDAVLAGDDTATRFHAHREGLWDWLFDPGVSHGGRRGLTDRSAHSLVASPESSDASAPASHGPS